MTNLQITRLMSKNKITPLQGYRLLKDNYTQMTDFQKERDYQMSMACLEAKRIRNIINQG